MLKLGFIGTGRIAQAHLKAAANLAQDVQVVSIAGRNRERAEKVAGQYGIPNVAGDYRQLLDDPNVHAVVITTPNDSHAEIPCAADGLVALRRAGRRIGDAAAGQPFA